MYSRTRYAEMVMACLNAAKAGNVELIEKYINLCKARGLGQADQLLLVSAYRTAKESSQTKVMELILAVPGMEQVALRNKL